MILAQTTTTVPLRSEEEQQRPFTEFVVDWFEMEEGSFPAELLDRIIEPLLQVILITLIAWLVVRMLRIVVRRVTRRFKEAPGRGPLALGEAPSVTTRRVQRIDALSTVISSAVGVVVWMVALFTILGSTFGVNIGPLLAGAGILGVALGFGAQDLVKDVLSGMFMLAEDQYGVGDVVDVGDTIIGVVEGVGLRTTRVRDLTGTLWHVPNGEIRRVGNMSQEWSRALLDVSVAYGADVDEAAEIIKDVADRMGGEEPYDSLFLAEPEIWGIQELGADAVAIRLVVKTLPGEQWAIGRELRRRIKLALDASSIEIPFPQRTIWVRREKEDGAVKREVRDPSAPSAATGKAAAEEGAHVTSDHQTEAPEPPEETT